ncbi:serine/threonine protein kinase RIO1 [Plasmodium gonderi]|uniref:non-specific serine/threonine protein kinase n=1 Tax=Plasmodium gonderi TaxID=77519 RepID=A0A1Y1JQC3_PLAGO|nr:serine/threonine protein kinase RIO1 [Plasmodium gonderi]GAW83685.1 serine/threonine protein kinase RIO1 [Plasmodium gonderi]
MKIRKDKIKTHEKDYNYGGFENYMYAKDVSNDVKSSLIEGEKLTNKFRNRGLTRDKRATVSTVLDNRTLLVLKKLKDNFLNEIYGVVSSGKEAYVFNSHKYLNEEELTGVKEVLLKYMQTTSAFTGAAAEEEAEEEKEEEKEEESSYKAHMNEGQVHIDGQYSDQQNMNKIHNDELGTDELSTDELSTDELSTDELSTDELRNDELGTDELKNDELSTDELKNDERSTDELGNVGVHNGEPRSDIHFPHESLYKVYHLRKHLEEKREETELEEDKNPTNMSGEAYDIIDKLSEFIPKEGKLIWNHFENKKIAISFATKVYNTSVLVFKKRSQYIEGEFRFRNAYTKNTNPRKMVKQWSEKEFRNLRRILICGLRCPYPLVLKSNVIVMSMLGTLDTACPKMKDLNFSLLKWKELYIECICILRQLYCSCKLVHADFSEYNLLYFFNHIYIIDVSQSMEHDHPYSLEFLKRDCLNITNFFKKKIGTFRNDKQEDTHHLNAMLHEAKIYQNITLKNRNACAYNNVQHMADASNNANTSNSSDVIERGDEKNGEHSKRSEFFYNRVQVLPLKTLFDYIVHSNPPEDVTFFLENDKKKICINPSEIIYLQFFGLVKNTTPIPKLNLKRIQQNRIYFEKLKRATGYYATKFAAQNRSHIKKHADKSQVEEQIFLSSWIPSHLNEIKDIRTIEKDLKLLKKGKSIVGNFISCNYNSEHNKHVQGNNTHAVHKNGERTHNSDGKIEAEVLRTNVDTTLHEQKAIVEECFTNKFSQKKDPNNYDNREDVREQGEDDHVREICQKDEDKALDELSLEKVSHANNLSDAHKSDIDNYENNCVNSEQEEGVKFKGIIPEGVTRKEWSKLVKEQNREKRKHKVPKYQKKKKKKKTHLKKK